MPDTEIGNAVWVISDRTHDDHYLVAIQVGPDTTIPLTDEQGVAYARAVYAAAAHAEYDAAVITQLTAAGVPLTDAGHAIVELRAERAPVDTGTRLTFTPIVSARDHRPSVHVALDGRVFTQWAPADARGHAGYVLDALEAVKLDAHYLALCVRPLGLPVDTARAMVGDLINHRQAEEE